MGGFMQLGVCMDRERQSRNSIRTNYNHKYMSN